MTDTYFISFPGQNYNIVHFISTSVLGDMMHDDAESESYTSVFNAKFCPSSGGSS